MVNSKQIFEEMHHQLLGFIRSKVNDDSTAEDILQDVFLKIHGRIESLKDESSLQSWIFQIARNAIVDHYRSRNKSEHVAISDEIASEHDDVPALEKLGLNIRGMIDALPAIHREALVLTELEGMSQKDFAEKFRLSYSAAKSRVQRARAALKEALLQCCHFEFDKFGTILDYYPVSCQCCSTKTPCSPENPC